MCQLYLNKAERGKKICSVRNKKPYWTRLVAPDQLISFLFPPPSLNRSHTFLEVTCFPYHPELSCLERPTPSHLPPFTLCNIAQASLSQKVLPVPPKPSVVSCSLRTVLLSFSCTYPGLLVSVHLYDYLNIYHTR